MTNPQIFITIAIISLVTFLIRSFPFLVLKNKTLSPFVLKIIDALPYATIALLVVYSLKDTSLTNPWPELISVIWIFIIHKWKHNTLLSIFSSTLLYCILIELL